MNKNIKFSRKSETTLQHVGLLELVDERLSNKGPDIPQADPGLFVGSPSTSLSSFFRSLFRFLLLSFLLLVTSSSPPLALTLLYYSYHLYFLNY
jgi:hypothetical protein